MLVTTPWTVDNDLITPTFKVKRNRIEDIYSANYERWKPRARRWSGSVSNSPERIWKNTARRKPGGVCRRLAWRTLQTHSVM